MTTFIEWSLGWQVFAVLYALLTLLIAVMVLRDMMGGSFPKWHHLDGLSRARRLGEAAMLVCLIIVAWPLIFAFVMVEDRWPGVMPRRLGRHLLEDVGSEPPEPPFEVISKHLGDAVDVFALEARARVSDPMNAVPNVPFGHLYPRWQQLRGHVSPGRQVRPFSVPRRGAQKGSRVNHVGWAVVTDKGKVLHHWVIDIEPESVVTVGLGQASHGKSS